MIVSKVSDGINDDTMVINTEDSTMVINDDHETLQSGMGTMVINDDDDEEEGTMKRMSPNHGSDFLYSCHYIVIFCILQF